MIYSLLWIVNEWMIRLIKSRQNLFGYVVLIELVNDLKAKWSIPRLSAIFARTGNSKRKRFAKRENKERITPAPQYPQR